MSGSESSLSEYRATDDEGSGDDGADNTTAAKSKGKVTAGPTKRINKYAKARRGMRRKDPQKMASGRTSRRQHKISTPTPVTEEAEEVDVSHIWVDLSGKTLLKLERKEYAPSKKDQEVDADIWNWVTTKATRLRKLIPAEAYNSNLSKKELDAIDLLANAKLYLTLINSLGECKVKDNYAAVTNIPRDVQGNYVQAGSTGVSLGGLKPKVTKNYEDWARQERAILVALEERLRQEISFLIIFVNRMWKEISDKELGLVALVQHIHAKVEEDGYVPVTDKLLTAMLPWGWMGITATDVREYLEQKRRAQITANTSTQTDLASTSSTQHGNIATTTSTPDSAVWQQQLQDAAVQESTTIATEGTVNTQNSSSMVMTPPTKVTSPMVVTPATKRTGITSTPVENPVMTAGEDQMTLVTADEATRMDIRRYLVPRASHLTRTTAATSTDVSTSGFRIPPRTSSLSHLGTDTMIAQSTTTEVDTTDIVMAGERVDGEEDTVGDGRVSKGKRSLQSGAPSPEYKRQRTRWNGWLGFGGK